MTKTHPDKKPPTNEEVERMPKLQQLYTKRHETELQQHGDDRVKAVEDYQGGTGGREEDA